MNIQLLTPKSILYNKNSNKNYGDSAYINPKICGLQTDTVSFSGRINTMKQASNKLYDAFCDGYEARIPGYKVLVTRFRDSLAAVGKELEEFGVVFDGEYCTEERMIKNTGSFISKLKREGGAPSDRVRGTLYLENLYNLSIFSEHILPALERRGYKLASIPVKRSGKKVLSSKPDFDVRLSNVPEEAKKALPEALRNAASFQEQSSGYCDIQLRLIDTLTNSKEKTPIELLIVAGKNTAHAKSDESHYVYDIVRALKKNLHIAQIPTPHINSPAQRIQNNLEIIRQQLNNYISRPLFANAKNLDIYHDDFQLPVELSENTCRALTGLVEGMRQKTKFHYNAKLNEIKKDDQVVEMIIKSSPEFKERGDDIIYANDIREKRRQLIKEINQDKREDLELIDCVMKRLEETIEKYGVKK